MLLCAYACEPGTGSEGGVGWNWTRQVARRNACVLLTRANNVEAIRTAAAQEGFPNFEVIGFDLPYWMRFWKRKGRGALLYFYLWQLGIAFKARRLDRARDFELVHHLTFVSSWTPAGLAWVPKPFVWGPVGQHPRIPKRFLQGAPLGLRLGEGLKAGVKWCALHLDPFLRHTMRRAARVLSLGSEFERRSGILKHPHLERMPAVGVEALTPGVKGAGRVLFAGRLVALKGPELALAAFALAHQRRPELRMTFLGEGPLRSKLEAQARALGLGQVVDFAGRLPLKESLAAMAEADFFLFPSFEGAGMVVPEAMAAGAVVLCLDFGGPGDMTRGGRGLALPLGATPEATCRALADGLLALLEDPARCDKLRGRALRWIEAEMLWDKKGDRLQAIYESVLGETKLKR